ncbi:hypothetical protein R3P38DRAFT_2759616 [Favolaschia claudopus]|uniref:Uncharacterized protein n=1 Tax=Favolaschia claudopus TaxID=2862362 RepID=A0AAW0E0G8_9AGAR
MAEMWQMGKFDQTPLRRAGNPRATERREEEGRKRKTLQDDRRKKEEGERREEVGSGSRQKGGIDKMPKWNPGEVEPRTTDIKTTTPQEHKEGRQQGRLEPAGWWKPIRNKTKTGLGRAGARPDEGGHVIGPDEGPDESEEPGELGKVERSTRRLARKPRDERGSRSRLDEVEQVQVSKGGLAEGVGTSRTKGRPRLQGAGRVRTRIREVSEHKTKSCCQEEKSGQEGDEREEIRTVRQGDNVNYQTKEYKRETLRI